MADRVAVCSGFSGFSCIYYVGGGHPTTQHELPGGRSFKKTVDIFIFSQLCILFVYKRVQ